MIVGGTGAGGTLARLIADSAAVRGQVDTLTRQVSSGRVADTLGGLGTAARTTLTLRPQLARGEAWQGNIDAAQGRLGVAQTALKGIAGVAAKFYADTNKLNTSPDSPVDSVAQAAREALKTVAGLLNSRDGDTYVFAGEDTANPPVPDSDGILTSSFVTGISAAVQGLATNGTAATTAATLAAAAGTSPFSAAPGAADAPRIEVGEGQYVQVGVLADRNTLAKSEGTSTTGSYMRDVMRALATIGSLGGGQVTTPGFMDLVADTRASLGGAIKAMGEETGALGNLEAGLDARKTQLGDQAVALKTQLSSVEDVDWAEAAARLTETRTRLEASYKLISGTKGLSLVDFL